MNRRDEQIAALKQRTGRLRSDRLKECYDQVLRGYESESFVENLARVVEEKDRTPSDFRILTNSEARAFETFNDDSYSWDFFCSHLGRSIALGEGRHIFEELQKVAAEGDPISAAYPSFHTLTNAATVLRDRGFAPDALCAPIGLFVPFAGDKSLHIDWNSPAGEALVLPDGQRLKLYWSNRGAPLDRFILLDSRHMTWRVKPDPSTGGRLTSAIGESVTQAGEDAVVFLAETVAKFEVEPAAMFAIPLQGDPLEPEEYARRETLMEFSRG